MAVGTGTILATAMLGGGLLSSGMQAKAGNQQAKYLTQQGEYKAQVYDQQAQMILEKKKLQNYQGDRAIARARSSVIAQTSSKGLNFGGSALAIAIDNETQMLLDQAVGNYNLDVERNFALSAATATRYDSQQQSKLAKSTGYSNAFSTLLNTASNFAMLKMPTRAGKL